ncbi:MAG: hypothetical protein JST00_26655 [Deltaproteobacteria bacterium]|nr:hypothetical protein [Deltaproteobacteria bacterium]
MASCSTSRSARFWLALSVAVAGGAVGFAPTVALAEDPAPGAMPTTPVPAALMTGLAAHAQRFEDMKKRGGFLFSGKMEELASDGKVDETKEIVVRITPRPEPASPIAEVIKYLENGADKTDEARKKAEERKAKPKKKSDKELHFPFLASEQRRYTFGVAERSADGRARIVFRPLEPAEDAIKGSAWVDEATGEVLSMGFSFSKNPIFIDHVDIQITFGMATPLGRAPSQIAFDGRGGFLVIRKHYRGHATFSEPKVAF